jgi:hypothetical protein
MQRVTICCEKGCHMLEFTLIIICRHKGSVVVMPWVKNNALLQLTPYVCKLLSK